MRKLTGLTAAAVLTLGLVAPASAAPPERGEEFIWSIILDEPHGLVAFWNMSRADFCGWEASDFAGEPPVDHLIPISFVSQPTGAIKVTWADTAPLELWLLDEDAQFTGPCEDTDDSQSPWATGSAMTIGDNDLDHPGSVENGLRRTNSFGERGNGSVTDGHGMTWKYGWTGRVVFDKDLDFRDIVPFRTVLAPSR